MIALPCTGFQHYNFKCGVHSPPLAFLDFFYPFQPARITFSHKVSTATIVIYSFTSHTMIGIRLLLSGATAISSRNPQEHHRICVAEKVHYAMPRRSLRDVVCSSYNTASQKGMHAPDHHAGSALKERCSLFCSMPAPSLCKHPQTVRLERVAAIWKPAGFITVLARKSFRPKST